MNRIHDNIKEIGGCTNPIITYEGIFCRSDKSSILLVQNHVYMLGQSFVNLLQIQKKFTVGYILLVSHIETK
jgi:hypothetical protein